MLGYGMYLFRLEFLRNLVVSRCNVVCSAATGGPLHGTRSMIWTTLAQGGLASAQRRVDHVAPDLNVILLYAGVHIVAGRTIVVDSLGERAGTAE